MTDSVTPTIKDIRKQLRLAMNGVVSTSMREKGAAYKLNFGVSLPKIKEIATCYSPDSMLAEALWKEDVRELKILATLLQPVNGFTPTQAEEWALTINQQEIAELFTSHLLQQLPYAESLATEWIRRPEEYLRVSGFLLFARLCMQGITLQANNITALIHEAKKNMDAGVSRTQRAALVALKRLGRQSPQQAATVLEALSSYPDSDSPEKREFYEDLKFEFDYYL